MEFRVGIDKRKCQLWNRTTTNKIAFDESSEYITTCYSNIA